MPRKTSGPTTPGTDYAGWFCVATDPFPCPADGCTFVAMFMTAAHLILVWEHVTTRTCSATRSGRRRSGATRGSCATSRRSAPSASYYAWEAAGRPVHGIRK